MTCNLNSNNYGLSFGSNLNSKYLPRHINKGLCNWTTFTEHNTQRLLFESPLTFIMFNIVKKLKFIIRLCDKLDKLKEKYAGNIQKNISNKEFDLYI